MRANTICAKLRAEGYTIVGEGGEEIRTEKTQHEKADLVYLR